MLHTFSFAKSFFLFLLPLLLVTVSCNGNGGASDSGGAIYTGGSPAAPSGTGSTQDSSVGVEDILSMANADDTDSIVAVLTGGGERGTSQRQNITLSADGIGLPAGGSATLTITGGGINFTATARADVNGNINYEIPALVSGSEITASLSVKTADGTVLYAGSKTQTISSDTSQIQISLRRQYWLMPSGISAAASPSTLAYTSATADSDSVTFSIIGLEGAPEGVAYRWTDEAGNVVGTGPSLSRSVTQMLGTGYVPSAATETKTFSVEASYTDAAGTRTVLTASATATIVTTATLTLDAPGIQTDGGRMLLVMRKGGSGVSVSADVLLFGGTPSYTWSVPPAEGIVSLSATSDANVTVSPVLGGMSTVTVTADLGDRTLTRELDVYVLEAGMSGTDIPGGTAAGTAPVTASPIILTDKETDSTSLTASLTGLPSIAGVTYSWEVLDSSVASVSPADGAGTVVSPAAAGATSVRLTATYKGVSAECSYPLNVAGLSLSVGADAVAGEIVLAKDGSATVTATVSNVSGSVTYNWSAASGSPADLLAGSDASRTVGSATGGKYTVTVKATVGSRELEKEFDVYVLDLELGGSGLPASATAAISMLCSETASAALTASLDGLDGLEDVTYGWEVGDGKVASASSTDTEDTTLTPVSAGSTTVKATATYKGVTVESAERNVSVAGFTLTISIVSGVDNLGDGSFFLRPDIPYYSISYIFSYTGISASDVEYILSDPDSYSSSDSSVASAGAATSGSSCQVLPSSGGSTTIKVKMKHTDTGEIIVGEKTITIFQLALSRDGASSSWRSPDGMLVGDSASLTATLVGADPSECSYSWTTGDSGIISLASLSPTTGESVTATGQSAGSTDITVTASYDGKVFSGSKSFTVFSP